LFILPHRDELCTSPPATFALLGFLDGLWTNAETVVGARLVIPLMKVVARLIASAVGVRHAEMSFSRMPTDVLDRSALKILTFLYDNRQFADDRDGEPLFLHERMSEFLTSKLADGLTLEFILFVSRQLIDPSVVEIPDSEIVSAIVESIWFEKDELLQVLSVIRFAKWANCAELLTPSHDNELSPLVRFALTRLL
jgi:hypothetical protein